MEELLPGLPDDVALECLVRAQFGSFPAMRSVCRFWRHKVESSEFHRLRNSVGTARNIVALVQAEATLAEFEPAKKYYSAAAHVYRVVLFDAADSSWTTLPPVPGLPRGLPLFCHLAATSQELVVVGGWDPETWAVSDAVYVYSFITGAWRVGAPMPGPGRSFFACAANATTVLVAGGHDEEKNALKSVVAYDVAADRWIPMPDMNQERDESRGIYMQGKFWVIGGYSTGAQGQFCRSAEVFDPATAEWILVEELLEEGTCPRTLTVTDNGRMYMCLPGGQIKVRGSDGGPWKTASLVPEESRVSALAATVGNGKVAVMGSGIHGGSMAAYLLEEGGKRTAWSKAAVPAEYSGHTQAAAVICI